jgi:hypothetical protein
MSAEVIDNRSQVKKQSVLAIAFAEGAQTPELSLVASGHNGRYSQRGKR